MYDELFEAACASGLVYDMLEGYGCSIEEADEILSMI